MSSGTGLHPWHAHTRPLDGGVECGRKWGEIGIDTPGFPPPLLGGHFTLQPPPLTHKPHPTTRLKQEAGKEAFVTQIT